MKTFKSLNIYMLGCVLFFSAGIFAQQSQQNFINYQGVAYDGNDVVLINEVVDIRIALRFGAPNAAIDYAEDHTVTTNAAGVFNLQIGTGAVVTGNFTSLEWGNLAPFASIMLNGTTAGTVRLHSVPYANASGKAKNMILNDLTDVDGTPTNGQVLKFNGIDWAPANDNGGSGDTYTAGDGVIISGTNEISVVLGTDIETNELLDNAVTTAKIDNNAVTGDKIAQMAATNGQVLKFNGIDWVPANDNTGGGGSTYTAGDGINISGTNEIMAALGTSISNAELDADAVTGDKIAQMAATNGQVLKFNGTDWVPANDNTGGGGSTYTAGDGINISGTNEITAALGTSISNAELDADAVTNVKIINGAISTAKVQDNAITGVKIDNDAITGDKIAPMAATNGQVLKYDGTDWVPANDNTGGGGSTYTAGDGINISGTNEITAALGTSISTAELETDAVTNVKIINGAISTAKVQDNAITGAKIAPMAATSGQVLKYDGTDWAPATDNEGTGSLWDEDAGDISYTSGNVGVGVSELEIGKRMHVGGDLFVQSNLGNIELGFPNNGNQWRMATNGMGARFQLGFKPIGTSLTDYFFTINQDGHVGIGNTNADEELVIGNNLGSGWAVPAATIGNAIGGGFQVGNSTTHIKLDAGSTFNRARIIVSNANGDGQGVIEMKTRQLNIGVNPGVNTTRTYPLRVVQNTVSSGGNFGFNLIDGSDPTKNWEIYVNGFSGNLTYYYNSLSRGVFDSTSGNYSATSDERLKTNITPMKTVTGKLTMLEAKTYNYKTNNNKVYNGFLAQDIQKLFPEVVTVSETRNPGEQEVLLVDYAQLTVLAIKAIQEQNAKIDAFEKRLNALEKR